MDKIGLWAEHSGILKLGEIEIPCFVLNNKKRVLVQREVIYLLTGNRKGGLDRYTKAEGVKDYMPTKYVDMTHKESAVLFSVGNTVAYGYEATDIIDICEGYLQARTAGTLHPSQHELAAKAEMFIRASAKVGIEALIDEATGYQAVRDADELQVKLKAYLAEALNEWTKTFPKEFFGQLFRLEGRRAPVPPKPYPLRFGRYVMRYVYDTMDPDVADWLRENNPKPAGQKHHFQWLTKDFGYEKLSRHLMSVLGIMKASTSMESFKENINRAFPEARAKRRSKRVPDNQTELTFIG
jgi:hypothetical protein